MAWRKELNKKQKVFTKFLKNVKLFFITTRKSSRNWYQSHGIGMESYILVESQKYGESQDQELDPSLHRASQQTKEHYYYLNCIEEVNYSLFCPRPFSWRYGEGGK